MVINPPKETTQDKIINVAKSTADALGPVGSAISNIASIFFTPPLQKARAQFEQDLCDTINKIESTGLVLEDLQNNEEVMTILIQATKIGMLSFQKEKREALKNAMFNATQLDAPEYILQQIFLNCIERFTTSHIKVLMTLNNPSKQLSDGKHSIPSMGGMGSVMHIIHTTCPELKSDKDLLNAIWSDLYSNGFVESDKSLLSTSMSSNGQLAKRTTFMGEKFIRFISE